MRLNDPEVVRAEYAEESRLEERIAAWQGLTGPNPRELALEAVAESRPRRVLEAGCGQGWAAEWIKGELGAEVVAIDQSERMVELTRRRGVDARVGDVQDLPFDDGSFDAALAAWMLYHVPDLDRTLAELRRVLRQGGRLFVATNGREHLADLLRAAGGEPLVTQFSSENAAEVLGRHFEHVVQRDIETRATFPDHAAARAYLATFAPALADTLPHFDGPRTYAGRTAVLSAH